MTEQTSNFNKKDYVYRMDGRVELVCSHGVGHPSFILTGQRKTIVSDFDMIHGCDGCCGHQSFQIVESELCKKKAEKVKRRRQ